MQATELLPESVAARDDPRGDDELLPVRARGLRARGDAVARGVLEAMGATGHADDGRAAHAPRRRRLLGAGAQGESD